MPVGAIAYDDDRRGVARRQPFATRRVFAQRSPAPGRASSADLDDELDLDRRIERQDGYADRAAGVLAGVAEGRTEQLARAVGDARLTGEVGSARDEDRGLDDADHLSRSSTCDFTAAIALSAHCVAQS